MTSRTRRSVLGLGFGAPLLLMASSSVRAACSNPDELSSTEIGMRESLDYEAASSKPDQACRGCSFFSAEGDDCGACQILGGQVDAKGHCSSWTKRK